MQTKANLYNAWIAVQTRIKSFRAVFKRMDPQNAEKTAVTAIRGKCRSAAPKWFRDMKIQYKLILAFGGLVSVLIFISVFSSNQLFHLDKKYSELISSTIGRQANIAQAISDMEQLYYINLTKGYLVTIGTNADEFKQLHENYVKHTDSFLMHIDKYCNILKNDKNLDDAEKQERLNDVNEVMYLYNYVYNPTVEILDESLFKNTQETHRIINENMRIGSLIVEKMEMIYTWASIMAEEISEETTTHSHNTILLLLVMAAFLGLLSIILSIIVTQRINTPIIRMKNAMLEISKGDLTYPIRSDRNDELGMLANKIGDMVDSLQNGQDELRLAIAAAEDSLKAKREFLDNMNHELRTPMNGILGFHRMALQTDMTEEQRRYITAADDSAKNLMEIINDIFDFTKIVDNKMMVDARLFKLPDVFNETLETYMPVINAKNLEFNMRLPSDMPEQIVGDPHKLKKILSSLIDNAVQFTEKGKITVRAKITEQTNHHIEMCFYVRDTGIGIKPEQMKSLFDPFWQADTSLTRAHGGIGFGLPLSKQLAALLGGKLWAESEYEEGSTFYFTARFSLSGASDLAADDTHTAVIPQAEAANEQVHAPNNSHLLVVDDVEVNQMIAEEILKDNGYAVDIANNGQEALDMISVNDYDAVLMDIQMPVMDGLTAATKIREDGKHKNLPIIAVSAHAMEEDIEKSLAYGMNDHITKPINPEILFMTLNKWLNRSHT